MQYVTFLAPKLVKYFGICLLILARVILIHCDKNVSSQFLFIFYLVIILSIHAEKIEEVHNYVVQIVNYKRMGK